MASLYEIPVKTLDGTPTTLAEHDGRAVLVVNVASKCGLTPQYKDLEKLHEQYAARGFSVVGFPCNQFGAQEPGSPEQIQTFCSTTYGVTFPLYEKIEVNGRDRHPIYGELLERSGNTDDISWNFEKFLVAPGATTVKRFPPATQPFDAELVKALEAALPR